MVVGYVLIMGSLAVGLRLVRRSAPEPGAEAARRPEPAPPPAPACAGRRAGARPALAPVPCRRPGDGPGAPGPARDHAARARVAAA